MENERPCLAFLQKTLLRSSDEKWQRRFFLCVPILKKCFTQYFSVKLTEPQLTGNMVLNQIYCYWCKHWGGSNWESSSTEIATSVACYYDVCTAENYSQSVTLCTKFLPKMSAIPFGINFVFSVCKITPKPPNENK